MKANLDQDIITGWTTDHGTEVGSAPPGVGLERLRFDGEKVVDLATLTTIHVTREAGVFNLHCVPVPGSQAVTMAYADRRNLVSDNNTFRALTPVEIADKDTAKSNGRLKAKLRTELAADMGDTPDLLADVTKCLTLILTHLAGGVGAAEAKTVIDAIAPAYADIYPLDKTQASLERNAAVLKARMDEYYRSIGE